MKEYRRALVALNLKGFVDSLILQKAKDLFSRYHTELMLMHCLEHFNSYAEAYGMLAGLLVFIWGQGWLVRLPRSRRVPGGRCDRISVARR